MAEVMPKKMNWQREHAQKFSRDKQEVGVLRSMLEAQNMDCQTDLGLPRQVAPNVSEVGRGTR